MKASFSKTYNLTVDIFTESVDDFASVYSNTYLNTASILLYIIGMLSCAGLCLVSWFERSGLAGPYRTLKNRLFIFCLEQMIIHFVVTNSIDILRVFYGVLPRFLCTFNFFIKVWTAVNIAIFSMGVNATKFAFICFFKTIPMMNDRLISTLIFMNVNLVSFLSTSAKFYIEEKIPVTEKICTGIWTEDQDKRPVQLAAFTVVATFLFDLIFALSSKWLKYKGRNNIVPFNMKNSTESNLRVSLASFLMGAILCSLGFIYLILNRYLSYKI